MAYQFLEQNLNFFSSRHVRPLFRNLPKHSTALRIKSNIPSMGCKVWQKVAPADNSPHHRGRSPTGHHACSLRLKCFPLRDSHGSHSHFPSVSVKCYLSKNLPCPPCQTSSPTYLHTHTHTLPHHCFVSSLHPSHITYLLITVCLLIVPGTQQISVISAE